LKFTIHLKNEILTCLARGADKDKNYDSDELQRQQKQVVEIVAFKHGAQIKMTDEKSEGMCAVMSNGNRPSVRAWQGIAPSSPS
jgi:hypothetical protein